MELAFKMNAFAGREDSLEYAIRVISEAGFSSIGLVFDKPFMWLDDLKYKRMCEIQEMLRRADLKVASISSCTASGYWRDDKDLTPPGQRFGPAFTSPDPEERALRVGHTKSLIDFAIQLGIRHVDTSTGYQPKDMNFITAWSYTSECLKELAEYAQRKGVSLNIEYEPGEFGPGGLFVADAHTALAMIQDVGSPALGVTFDVGHSYVCAEDIPETIKLLGERTRVVEFDDIASEPDPETGLMKRRHHHLVPGDGDIDYGPIFVALEEIDYRGPIIVELYSLFESNPEEACRRTYEYLMREYGKYFS